MISNKIKKKLLDMYSICKDEFCIYEPFSTEEELYYHSKITKYMIVIEEEKEPICGSNIYKKTGRISVNHIDEKGKIQFKDIYLVENNEPVFLCRNKEGYNISAGEIIAIQEEEIKELKKKGRELIEQVQINNCFQKPITDQEILKLKQENRQLREELQQYSSVAIRKKPGRKNKFSSEKIQEILSEVNTGVPKSKIAEKYGCTRRTLYKIIENNK